MKKQLIGIVGLLLTLSIAMTGCSRSSSLAESSSSEDSNRVSSSQTASQSGEEDDKCDGILRYSQPV